MTIYGILLILGSTLQAYEQKPLIPRELFFGNPQKISVQISPDAKHISYLAPLIQNDEKSKLNIWIRSIDKTDDRPLTQVTDRSIQGYFWSNDSSELLFIRDTQGDENYRLYGISLSTGETTCYTPFDNIQVRSIPHSNDETSVLLLGINKDDPAMHDAYALDLKTKELKLICKNPGRVVQWVADKALQLRAALSIKEDGTQEILYRSDDASPWTVVKTYDFEDSAFNSFIHGFSAQHNLLYFSDYQGQNTIRIIALNPDTQESTVIAQDREYDISRIRLNPDTEDVELVMCDREKPSITVLKEGVCSRILKACGQNMTVSILSHDHSREHWIVALSSDRTPGIYYLYNDTDRSLTELFKARPDLDEKALVPMNPVQFTSSDGLTIHGYLTLPYLDAKQVPLVVLVHGGPESRDSWGYHGLVQWLANRGYAALQINYRGSLGYGKAFLEAGYREWGGKMQNDLTDGALWAIDQGIADPKKVAIFGGSYGGYAALCGATFTPDLYCCAIDMVGVSNLITMLKSYPPYWNVFLARRYITLGHPEKDEEFLKSRSPLFKVDAIEIPLLIAQGGKDPRVKKAESEQIVAELIKRNISHEYMLFEDEGHGLANADNRLLFFKKAEEFLAQHAGGLCY